MSGEVGRFEVAILIPCYNEAATIGKVVADFRAAAPEASIYVYDNNSSDDTAAIAREAGAIVVPEYRQGKGFVVRSMFRDIDADCYIMVDGDDTYPAEEAAALAELVREGQADMVVGDRLSSTYFAENQRAFHGFGNKLVRFSVNRIFASNVRDIMSGCRAFSRRFARTFPVLSGGFEIETEMTIHALDRNFLIREVPVTYRDRIEGSESKLSTFSDGFKVLGTIGTLFRDYRPFQFFSIAALALALIALGLFWAPFDEYVRTGFVKKVPSLVVSIAFAISALLAFACGVILDSIRTHSRQFYELAMTAMGDRDAEKGTNRR
jgi:glycosyltransferase involved in cell wall biosynthesis